MIVTSILSVWDSPRFALFAKHGAWPFILKSVRMAPPARLLARRRDKAATAPSPREPDHQTIERFATLMLPHLDSAYGFARYLTRGGDHAEDVVHDAYARALSAFGDYQGGDPKAWLLTIVRNCFISSTRRHSEIAVSDTLPEVADDADTPETAVARRQTSETVRRLVHALPVNLAEVIVLREVEDLSYKEIAAIIDVPIGTVMSRLARAREALAKAWRAQTGEGAP